MVEIKKLPSQYLMETDTDKVLEFQKYSNVYDLIISSLLSIAGTPLNVLEIGVSWNGIGDGHAFSTMPYVNQFVGIDRLPLKEPFPEKGVFVQSDAYSTKTVMELKKYAPFHLIIDDGIHEKDKQLFIFKNYFELLETPGIMVCEDIFDADVDAYKNEFIKEQRLDLHIISTPGKETPQTSGYNLLVLSNLSKEKGFIEHLDEKSLMRKSYYETLDSEKLWLESIFVLTPLESKRLEFIYKIFGNIPCQSNVDFINDWYDQIVDKRDDLKNSGDILYPAFQHFVLGISTPEEHRIVSDWYENENSESKIC